MALATWLRAMSAVGTVRKRPGTFAVLTRPRTRHPRNPIQPSRSRSGSPGVLVAALREAFDRDRARFDLEQAVHDAEAARRERALRLEWIRQTRYECRRPRDPPRAAQCRGLGGIGCSRGMAVPPGGIGEDRAWARVDRAERNGRRCGRYSPAVDDLAGPGGVCRGPW